MIDREAFWSWAERWADVLFWTDIAVIAQGEHLCMTMRGVRSPAVLRTSVLRGKFRNDARARAEFLSIVHG